MAEIRKIIKPQEGYQEAALSNPADIVIGGGSAGAGKTFSLLLDSIRHINVPGFQGVIFRRTTPQIKNPGGLWDKSLELYPLTGGTAKESINTWEFSHSNKIKFAHLEYEKDVLNYQGAEIPFIGFDELTHFTRKQFFYMISRNRSMSGIKPYIRATCNPDPDSWVAEFLEWWIDQESGFPIPERAGKIRYFTQDGDAIVWGDSVDEAVDKCPHIFNDPELSKFDKADLIKSVTFIPGSIYENKKLLEKDPAYLGNLLAQDEATKMMLLKGNWKIRQDGSALFNYIRINDLFSNYVEKTDEDFDAITCDYARQGRDLAIICTWEGMTVIRIQIFTKLAVNEAFNAIEQERERVHIPRSRVAVDEGGVGGGVIDLSGGEYMGFIANASALPNPITEIKENYDMLKTQCYYRFADKVNDAKASVKLDDIWVDGVQTDEVKIGSKIVSVQKLIKEDLRAIKKKNMDMDGKKKINSKEEQKNIIGRSPDFGDALSMIEFLKLAKEPEPGVAWI